VIVFLKIHWRSGNLLQKVLQGLQKAKKSRVPPQSKAVEEGASNDCFEDFAATSGEGVKQKI
jgi:hypothetical protein